jgi:hypothetical protein
MAVYKIFPYKDATLYSESELANTGLDAILEVKNFVDSKVSRFLTQFDSQDIFNKLTYIQDRNWDAYLKYFIAESSGLSLSTVIETFPVAQNWENGTGEFGDNPTTTDGVSWKYTISSGSFTWDVSGSVGLEPFTSSFLPNNPGGGNWFYSGSNKVTQSFDLRSDKDLTLKVTDIVDKWYSGSLPNYGFITKFDDSIEFSNNPNIQPILKYFSVDTNTIYPPVLEILWDDYETILTGSEPNILTDSNIKLSLNENPGVYYNNSKNRFRVNSSPLYPPRVFQTSSFFTNLNYLPTSSCYAVKDLDTNEYVINFDDIYTRISADAKGNYFDIYMDGLQPERYYKIQIKTTIDNSVKIFDDNYYFKVIN